MILEVCCGSFEDALKAHRAHAQRIELNCALELGGITPSVASLKLVKAHTDLEVICMVRPRGCGFCYTEDEYSQMQYEAKELLEAGADGLAFGFLTKDGSIDVERTSEFAALCHNHNASAVNHRAFDCLGCNTDKELEAAVSTLVDCGVDRILTSGMYPSAYEGMDNLKKLVEIANDSIEILPGVGINSRNVTEIVKKTGTNQVHASCKKYAVDMTTTAQRVSYAFEPNLKMEDGEFKYQVVSEQEARSILDVLNKI